MEKFNYKISLLELVGEMYTGVGVMLVIRDDENTYESLLWVSPDIANIVDRFIMPTEFLEREGITRFPEHPQYDEFLKQAWKVLPNRDMILKEGLKKTEE